MPYVPVPKDLAKVKTKVAFNLTSRQLICFSLAALVGLPVYFLSRSAVGNSTAVLLMITLMMPFFFVAMFERDGQPAEKILRNMVRHKLWPKHRPYRTDNLYISISKKEELPIAKNQAANLPRKKAAREHPTRKKEQKGHKKVSG